MSIFIRKQAYNGPVKAVVLDWAGTAVDYGSIGPAAVCQPHAQRRNRQHAD